MLHHLKRSGVVIGTIPDEVRKTKRSGLPLYHDNNGLWVFGDISVKNMGADHENSKLGRIDKRNISAKFALDIHGRVFGGKLPAPPPPPM